MAEFKGAHVDIKGLAAKVLGVEKPVVVERREMAKGAYDEARARLLGFDSKFVQQERPRTQILDVNYENVFARGSDYYRAMETEARATGKPMQADEYGRIGTTMERARDSVRPDKGHTTTSMPLADPVRAFSTGSSATSADISISTDPANLDGRRNARITDENSSTALPVAMAVVMQDARLDALTIEQKLQARVFARAATIIQPAQFLVQEFVEALQVGRMNTSGLKMELVEADELIGTMRGNMHEVGRYAYETWVAPEGKVSDEVFRRLEIVQLMMEGEPVAEMALKNSFEVADNDARSERLVSSKRDYYHKLMGLMGLPENLQHGMPSWQDYAVVGREGTGNTLADVMRAMRGYYQTVERAVVADGVSAEDIVGARKMVIAIDEIIGANANEAEVANSLRQHKEIIALVEGDIVTCIEQWKAKSYEIERSFWFPATIERRAHAIRDTDDTMASNALKVLSGLEFASTKIKVNGQNAIAPKLMPEFA